MKLNQNCVRDIMLYIEDEAKPGLYLSLNDFYNPVDKRNTKYQQNLAKYDKETIEYTLMKLSETKYLKDHPSIVENKLVGYNVDSISWEGHKFLDTIRDPKIWSATKKILSHLESVSISFTSQVASKVLEDYISKNTGFQFS